MKKSAPVLPGKVAGVSLPVSSLRTPENFGIGELLDLIPLIDWAAEHHLRLIQILHLGETAPAEASPYQALSGIALDPIYLRVSAIAEYEGNEPAKRLLADPAVERDLGQWRASGQVDHAPIRLLKLRLLDQCFERFYREEWLRETPRAKRLQEFVRSRPWLEEYALFRVLKERFNWHYWLEWPAPFRDRDPQALAELRRTDAKALLKTHYLQGLIYEQWKRVQQHARRRGVLIMGDLPFLASKDSADVWSDREGFGIEEAVGAPPDAFSEEGQSWGFPLFRWAAAEQSRFGWWRLRVRESKQFYDLLRLDHVVGFFRVWVFPAQGSPHFEPGEQAEQIRRGEALLDAIVEESGECIPVAEDLGVIPDFVRETLRKFQIAGHKIFRWEREENGCYYDPRDYPFISLATTGTHDTSTLATWWEEISQEDREEFLEVLGGEPQEGAGAFSEGLNERILEKVLESGSMLALFPFQDLFGLKEQINVPGTISPRNWSWRLPVDIEDLGRNPFFLKRSRFLRERIDAHGRFQSTEGDRRPEDGPG